MNVEILNEAQKDPVVRGAQKTINKWRNIRIAAGAFAASAASLTGYGAYELANYEHYHTLPSPTDEVRAKAKEFDRIWEETQHHMLDEKPELAAQVLVSEESREILLSSAEAKQQMIDYSNSERWDGVAEGFLMLPGFLFLAVGAGGVFIAGSARDYYKAGYQLALERKMLQIEESHRTEEEKKRRSILPPVGGKVYPMGSHAKRRIFFPRRSAEDLSQAIIAEKRQNRFGEEFVHQITVQGRVPDSFKYVAMAMVLHSPVVYDWDEPFFDADWGKVAPLIHDGGNTELDVSPYWNNPGRTDFIQRVYIVQEPDIGKLESVGKMERSKLPLSKQVLARSEQEEEERLTFENTFFQMAALAQHADTGDLHKELLPMQLDLSMIWRTFSEKMEMFFKREYMHSAIFTRWFNNFPSHKMGLLNRYEADYEPIKNVLIQIEQLKTENPKVFQEVHLYMEELIKSVLEVIDGYMESDS